MCWHVLRAQRRQSFTVRNRDADEEEEEDREPEVFGLTITLTVRLHGQLDPTRHYFFDRLLW